MQHPKRVLPAIQNCEKSLYYYFAGKLVPVKHQDKGLGGAVKIWFVCDGGCESEVHHSSSQLAFGYRRRSCVSLATALCFLVYGQGYPAYAKVLKIGLGMNVLAKSNFYRIIEIAHPHIKSVLDRMCERAKIKMKSKDPSLLGSWKRAVTTSDGCWLIRGFHSQCCTFVIIDFLSGGILYHGHLCMRGSNNICDTELWEGTSKSAEGHLAYKLFKKAKEEGMVCALNWQDQDSSSGRSFRSIFPDGNLSRVMLCGGHVGRSHGNNLKEYKGKKILDKGFISLHQKKFPEVSSVKCACEGKAHSKKCGCFSDDFLSAAKRNHFSALKQSGNSPSEYARRMRILGKYHSRDIHQWTSEDGEQEECGFHPLLVCSCGKCKDKCASETAANTESGADDNSEESDGSEVGGRECDESNDGDSESDEETEENEDSREDSDDKTDESEDSCEEEEDDITCPGKAYYTRQPLTCKLHALLYEIECDRVAGKAEEVIDVEMGRGHSNLPESKFNVLTRFRSKNVNLHQVHYEFSTNCGLCQSNMTFMYLEEGLEYHWMRELLSFMGLPIPDGLDEIWSKENEQRMKVLRQKQSATAKTARAKLKQKRSQERKKRFVVFFSFFASLGFLWTD